jgi:two-component system, OmpR family, response regulator QseB
MRVLLIEDDHGIAHGLKVSLQQRGYTVEHTTTLAQAWSILTLEPFDAVVLDLGLPDGDGIALLQRIRQPQSHNLPNPSLPILIATARDRVEQRIAGLNLGADDYIAKPFDINELEARLRALLRRAAGRASPTVRWGDIEVDPQNHSVHVNGKPLELAVKEFSLLLLLMEARGKVLSKQHIEQRLYNWQSTIESNAVEVHIHHLRRKIGTERIQTMRGVGYFMPQDAD